MVALLLTRGGESPGSLQAFSDTTPEGMEECLVIVGGCRIQVPHIVSIDTARYGGWTPQPRGGEISGSPLGISLTPP